MSLTSLNQRLEPRCKLRVLGAGRVQIRSRLLARSYSRLREEAWIGGAAAAAAAERERGGCGAGRASFPEGLRVPLLAARRGVSVWGPQLFRFSALVPETAYRTPRACRGSARSSSTIWKGRFPLRSSKGEEKREKPARRK